MLLQLKLLTYKLTGFHIPDFGAKYKKYLYFGKKHPVVDRDRKPSQKKKKMPEIGLMKHRLAPTQFLVYYTFYYTLYIYNSEGDSKESEFITKIFASIAYL